VKESKFLIDLILNIRKVNYFIHDGMNIVWIIPVCVLYIYIYIYISTTEMC